jgi:hypothetical protein
MATPTLESMITSLFTAPGRAAVEAEAGYRQIWADWLKTSAALVGNDVAALMKMAPQAPVMKFSGVLELSLSMRVASVSQVDGKISLGTGPISVSGGYFRQTSEESAMTVRGTFTLTNAEVDLTTYLSRMSLTPTDPASLTKAIDTLGKK